MIHNIQYTCRLFLSCVFLFALVFLSSCSSTKSLQENERLYTGASVEIQSKEKIKKSKSLKSSLESITQPEPNSKLFGLAPFRLWIHNAIKEPKKEKGLRNWLKYKLGEEPVLYKESDVTKTTALLKQYLRDHGYYQNRVNSKSDTSGRKVSVQYSVASSGQYKIANIIPFSDSTRLGRVLNYSLVESDLKVGKPLLVENLQSERSRIAEFARNNGYFNFSPSYIYYFVDSTAQPLAADVYLNIKYPEDSVSLERMYMDSTIVYATYTIDDDTRQLTRDTIKKKDIGFIQSKRFVRPRVIRRTIAQKSGELYSQERERVTINHLLDLNVYKFVDIKYQRLLDSLGNPRLLREIYLTPDKTQNVTAELEVNTRQGNTFGTGITGSYIHRNIFKGAEQFQISLTTGIETLFKQQSTPFISSFDVTVDARLTIPRFITPFRIKNVSTFYVPKTVISVNNSFRRRSNFYTINSLSTSFGYLWQESAQKRHELYPVSINFVDVFDTSSDFDSLLVSSPVLRRSFDDVFIVGLLYSYSLSNQELGSQKNYVYFKGTFESSGNTLFGINKAIQSDADPYTLAGVQYSQFVRITGESVYTIPIKKQQKLLLRGYVGAAIPYGNSDIVPYVKQFFAGGGNSNRGFRVRSLGPGSFTPVDNQDDNANQGFIDQSGDLKLEANAEYRFTLFGPLKGATFVDAGNVWLLRDDPPETRIGGAFRANRFYREIAISSGLGLRFDIDLLVLRFDVGFPLRDPSFDTDERWRVRQFDPFSKSWRQSNLAFHIALGYPF